MLLSNILSEGEYTSAHSPSAIEFSRIVTNTALLEKNCLFVCIQGQHFDTHSMASLAVSAGAVAIIAEDAKKLHLPEKFPVFFVKDTRATLSHLVSRYHGERWKKSKLIAITGTNGKTSTLYLTDAILRHAGYRVGTVGTVDITLDGKPLPLTKAEESAVKTMTTPDPMILFPIICRMADAGADYIIMEASSHALSQKKLSPLTFTLGLFTNLSPEHLDFHSNMEEYLRAKALLFPLCARAVLNADSPYSYEIMRRTGVKSLLVGSEPSCDYHTHDVVSKGSHGASFSLTYGKQTLRFNTNLSGIYNVENARLATAAALALGVDGEVIREALSAFKGIPGRLERLTDATMPFTVFIDYAHTETALKRLLQTVCAFRAPSERIVLVFGCGGDRDKTKRAPMGMTAEAYADLSIVTSDNPRSENPMAIIKEILRGMPDTARRRVIVDRERAICEAILNAKEGDIILLCGKGHENYEITADGIHPFDERMIVKHALSLRQRDK